MMSKKLDNMLQTPHLVHPLNQENIQEKLKDSQINHFLDFLQHSGVMQNVASGTRTVKLSTGRKIKIPNAVRTVHKTEAIRLYISACDMESYTQMNKRPSERTLWNIK